MALREQKKNPTCCPLRGFIKRGKKKTAKCFLLNDPKKKDFLLVEEKPPGGHQELSSERHKQNSRETKPPPGSPRWYSPKGPQGAFFWKWKKKVKFFLGKKTHLGAPCVFERTKKTYLRARKTAWGPQVAFLLPKMRCFFWVRFSSLNIEGIKKRGRNCRILRFVFQSVAKDD